MKAPPAWRNFEPADHLFSERLLMSSIPSPSESEAADDGTQNPR